MKEVKEFPEEYLAIENWKRKEVDELLQSKFGVSERTIRRDISDLIQLLNEGKIDRIECPLKYGKRSRNRILKIRAVCALYYYRQLVEIYKDRQTAMEDLEIDGLPI